MFSFNKSKRISLKHEFKRAFKFGSVFRGKNLIFSYYFDRSNSYPRLGITVNKKYGGSVKRNLFKRLVRENFRKLQYEIPNKIVVNVSPLFSSSHVCSYNFFNKDFLLFIASLG